MNTKNSATATVVNFGVFFRHLRETVKPAKPKPEIKPLINPNNDLSPLASNEIMIIPIAEIIIANNVVREIFSFKKIFVNIAAINGIAAILNIVIAAVV